LQLAAPAGLGPAARAPLIGLKDLMPARLDNPMMRPEIATMIRKAAARVQARGDAAEELGDEEFRLGYLQSLHSLHVRHFPIQVQSFVPFIVNLPHRLYNFWKNYHIFFF
jgi:hypothetical protein